MEDTLGAILILQAIVSGITASTILNPSGNVSAKGFLLGLFLGPWGVVIAWSMRDNGKHAEVLERLQQIALASRPRASPRRDERECQHCGEMVLAKANVCKHCGRDLA